MTSSMASPEDDPSKLPTYQELIVELGLGTKYSDTTLVSGFKHARYKCYNNFLATTGISEKRLSEWSTDECQEGLKQLAKSFLNVEGNRFWPDKPRPANRKGYTFQKHRATLTSLLVKEPYPEDSPTSDNFPDILPSLPAEAPPQDSFRQPVTRLSNRPASKRPAETELGEDQHRAKNPRCFDPFVPLSDDDTADSAFSDVSDRVFREFNNRENRSKRRNRLPGDEEQDPSSTHANARSSTVDSGVFVGGAANEENQTTTSERPTNAAPLPHGCPESGEETRMHPGEVQVESKLDAPTHVAGPSHELSTASEQIPVNLIDDIDGISDSWALGNGLTPQKGLDDMRGSRFPMEKSENPYRALLNIPSKRQLYFDCEHARSVLDNHLRSHTTHTDTPIKFAFAVRHCTGHADRFTFSPYSFFDMTLQEFVEALPMEDKEKITGLCIRQYSGTVTHLRQVYLYNEEVFGNIREEFMRHIENDIRKAKCMGKRLDYEISIEPLTDDDC
ncbi:hypothetical protein NW768_006630 [Fusarium equiseti]|uniref:Uncharacterized protein n=1 Tax=Fusarium equiseti TaxID=61235 RepID=A0ABQ8RC31_FUSEQ|nr:hypothetical protein NW768_006630 [Fusarium equiseti]